MTLEAQIASICAAPTGPGGDRCWSRTSCSGDLICRDSDTPLPRLMRLLQRRGVRHLPVVDQQELMGIISDRDLKGAIASAATSESAANLLSRLDRLTAADIMTRSVVTVAPLVHVEEAARIMVTKQISALQLYRKAACWGW